jgi:hypothetical protein
MTALRNRLRESDPTVMETGLDEGDAMHIRNAILTASTAPRMRIGVAAPLAIALLCVSAGSAWFVRTSVPEVAVEVAPARQRQLQFSTAGGTRVIWFFNPDFEVR